MNNCNGNCNQGRPCDCEPDANYGTDEELTHAERVTLWVIVLVSMALSISFIGFGVGLLMLWI